MPEETKTVPPWVAYRRDYRAFLDEWPHETMAEAYSATVAAQWRALGVGPYEAAKWVALGMLPTPQVARWVLDGVTPELHVDCDMPTRSEWRRHRHGLNSTWRERALRFIGVTDTED